MAETSIRYLHDQASNIEIIFCRNSNISYPLHNHISVVTIGLLLQGSVLVTKNNKPIVYRQDQSFVLLPYETHVIKALESYSLLTVCIKISALIKSGSSDIKKEICKLICLSEIQVSEVQIKKVLRYIDTIDIEKIPTLSEPYETTVRRLTECSPEAKISVDEIARSAYISKYYFIRNFKKAVGLTPHQFRLQVRIRKAQHLLSDIDRIAEVALAAGFYDQSHFIKQFEKIVRLSPSAYRNACQFIKAD